MRLTIARINPISFTVAVVLVLAGAWMTKTTQEPAYVVAAAVVGVLVVVSLQMAQAWERAVILRAGRFVRVAEPGLFWIVPIVESVTAWIDQRVVTTPFSAEKALTKDTVPVNVDAVLFSVVWDARKAALEVASYTSAIAWASQTALREVIGAATLSELLSDRHAIGERLQASIDARTTPWGITVQSVEIRDIRIPDALEDAMSRQAQAEREREARIILSQAEADIADVFRVAARAYENDPIALHLRAMNMLYEGLKEKGAMLVVPSSAVETMGLGTIGGLSGIAGGGGAK
ncbi:MAG: slipin family protein [bacterium]|nr:slipin family protein [bacterium]